MNLKKRLVKMSKNRTFKITRLKKIKMRVRQKKMAILKIGKSKKLNKISHKMR